MFNFKKASIIFLKVRVDKKVNSWSGSVEVGVTSTDPDNLSRIQPFPSSANELRQGKYFIHLYLLGFYRKKKCTFPNNIYYVKYFIRFRVMDNEWKYNTKRW